MGANSDPLRVLAALLLLGLAACQPRATVTSNRAAAYDKDVKRLMVVETVGNQLGAQHESFHTMFSQKAQACGASGAFRRGSARPGRAAHRGRCDRWRAAPSSRAR